MTEFGGNLRGVLNCVETLVKNIRRRRDLVVEAIDGKQCVSTKQLSNLLNTFVDQILDDDKTSDENLCQSIAADEPHKDLSTDMNAHKVIENQLRQQISFLEESLKKGTEDKQRIQKHCSKIMEKCEKNDDNHKTQIRELNQTIENLKKSESELKISVSELKKSELELKKSESELKSRINELMDRSVVKQDSDPLIQAMKCEVKRELLQRTVVKKEEPQIETQLNGIHNESMQVLETEEKEEDKEEDEPSVNGEDETLKSKCLSSRLSIILGERVPSSLDSHNESIVEEEVDDSSDVESVIDLTLNTNKTNSRALRKRSFGSHLTDMPYIKRGIGINIRFHCTTKDCGFVCSTTEEIVEHIHSCQGIEITKFVCDDCPRVFLSKNGLSIHRSYKHSHNTKDETKQAEPKPKKTRFHKTTRNLRQLKRLCYV